MSNHYHKSAAVPFVNQKGERSMKRVKVPRYFAGKRPAYAKEEDEEEYVTDEEEEGYDEEKEYNSDEEYDEEEENEYRVATTSRNLKLDHLAHESDDEEESSSDKSDADVPSAHMFKHTNDAQDNAEEEEDDDPRARRLRQIKAKANPADLINVQRTQQIPSRYNTSGSNVVLDEDDDEEEVRRRHALARGRQLEKPLGPQAILATSSANQELELVNDEDDDEDSARQAKRLDTEDILKDLKLTGISRPVRERQKTEEDQAAESRRLKEMLEQAKQEAAMTSQTYKKVEEDIRREREREALAKGDIGAREMSAVITDDEDEELAYEEWKFREIKRVQRDRAERVSLTTAKVR